MNRMDWPYEFQEAISGSFAYLLALGYKPKFKRDGDWYAEIRYKNRAGDTILIAACPQRLECDVELIHRKNGTASLRELEQTFPNQRGPRQRYSIFDTTSDLQTLQSFVSTLAEQFKQVATPILTNEALWSEVNARTSE